MSWWWLSFAGEEFLGAAVVEGSDFLSAVARATELGINPGGEVLGTRIPGQSLWRFPEKCRNRLLGKEEVISKLGGRMVAADGLGPNLKVVEEN